MQDNRVAHQARGGSLIEVMLALSLLAILAASWYSMMAGQSMQATREQVQWQSLALAQTVLAEVQALPARSLDPDGGPDQTGPEPGEARDSAGAPFDHVNDYDGWVMRSPLRDRSGQLWPVGADWRVAVTVRPRAVVDLPAESGWWIEVVVEGPAGVAVRLEALRVAQS